MRQAGRLGDGWTIEAVEEPFDTPPRRFALNVAVGERIVFTRNDNRLGVRNGTLGTIEQLQAGGMVVKLDGRDARRVQVELAKYRNIDHGFAMTVHKAQVATVARAHVLADSFVDRHIAYVALSPHRAGVALHYDQETFRSQEQLVRRMSRERTKESTLDYLDQGLAGLHPPAPLGNVASQDRERSREPLSRSEQIRQAMNGWRQKNGGRDFGLER